MDQLASSRREQLAGHGVDADGPVEIEDRHLDEVDGHADRVMQEFLHTSHERATNLRSRPLSSLRLLFQDGRPPPRDGCGLISAAGLAETAADGAASDERTLHGSAGQMWEWT